ncbi:MAG: hypothetical protein QXX41_04855 [Nitrososphaerota archaeon]
MGTNICDKPKTKRSSTKQETDDLIREMEIIGKILSERWKTKIFLEVYKMAIKNPKICLSGYSLAHLTKKSFSTVYNFLHEMEREGIFEFLDEVNNIRKVRITKYGQEIYEKIKNIIPQSMSF